jgi:hypothetical protein
LIKIRDAHLKEYNELREHFLVGERISEQEIDTIHSQTLRVIEANADDDDETILYNYCIMYIVLCVTTL